MPEGMCGTGEAGIITADGNLNAIEDALGYVPALDILTGHVKHGFIHRQVIMAGGNDQIHLFDLPGFVHFIMMD
jgi:hypothetical protein